MYDFFGEKHGKSACDSEFSVLSQWLNQITSTTRIHDTTTLIQHLEIKAKENQLENQGKKRIFIVYEREKEETNYKVLEISDFGDYHMFTCMGDEQIKCKVTSNSTK